MTLSTSLRLLAVFTLALAAARAERWQMQYYYDEDRSSLTINDLAFPTPQRGVAVGFISEKERTKGAAVVTSDGGAHWSLVSLPDPGVSVYFLNDTNGWVVTPKGILRTEEGGRSWRKLPKSPKGVLRVWFTSPQHGYAVGLKKSVWETADGGGKWTRLAAADEVKSNPDHTVYSGIAFTGKVGMITGWSRAPRREELELPDWMEPEKAARRREWPSMSISLETRNGGESWSASTVAILGNITRVHLAPDGRALALIEFRNSFPYPGEVYAINWKGGSSQRVFREKDRAVTDAALAASGPAFLAAVEVPGKMLRAPIPSRLHILSSTDLKQWKDMEVDYRASAERAVLAVVDEANAWAATDTGMILKLVP